MISTAGNIVGLTALISGIYCHFQHHPDAIVELKYGDPTLNEQFIATSDKLDGELRISMEQTGMYIRVTRDGVAVWWRQQESFEKDDRSDLRKTCIGLLNGTIEIA